MPDGRTPPLEPPLRPSRWSVGLASGPERGSGCTCLGVSFRVGGRRRSPPTALRSKAPSLQLVSLVIGEGSGGGVLSQGADGSLAGRVAESTEDGVRANTSSQYRRGYSQR